MSSGSSHPSFVMGMSLAEVFLLLLFAFFLAFILGRPDTDLACIQMRLRVAEAKLRAEQERNQKLQAEVDSLGAENSDALLAMDILIAIVNEKLDRGWLLKLVREHPEQVADVVKKQIERLRRGCDKCAESNVLVYVRAVYGDFHVEVLNIDEKFAAFLKERAIEAEIGETMRDQERIDAFLQAAYDYGCQAKPECRFDYTLEYATPEDYEVVRQGHVERCLYPGRITRVRP